MEVWEHCPRIATEGQFFNYVAPLLTRSTAKFELTFSGPCCDGLRTQAGLALKNGEEYH